MSDHRQLFSFVDYKDPFAASELAGESCPGAILSILQAQAFERVHLFSTPGLEENAGATGTAIRERWPECHVERHKLPVSDPKDYSQIMGFLARRVRDIAARGPESEDFVCVSSGTAEIRAAWFLLAASGLLPARLLQVGSPARPLFGPSHVHEVNLGSEDWLSLRDLVMPQQYFDLSRAGVEPAAEPLVALPPLRRRRSCGAVATMLSPAVAPTRLPQPSALDESLQKLGIVIGSAVLRAAAERIAIAAQSRHPILLLGETGTGKDMFARLAHELSTRSQKSLVAVNCAAIPKDLVESHLFGHVKGAFTGATADHDGKFVQAGGSTLFLDEIAELPLEAQAKLLRVLQDSHVEPVGAGMPRYVDVRIVAATNRDVQQEVAAGRFRKDLYYRLEVVAIHMPPLRERPNEIAELTLELLHRINQRREKPRRLSKSALRRLEQHSWPGNVRELSNVLERSVLYASEDVLGPADLLITAPEPAADPLSSLPEPCPGFSMEAFLDLVRKQLILRALERCGGNQSAAAGILGVSKQNINQFLKKYGKSG